MLSRQAECRYAECHDAFTTWSNIYGGAWSLQETITSGEVSVQL
jgi:hypothetical protein